MYACSSLNELNECVEWVEYNNFIVELSSLTYEQSTTLLSLTALLFGSSWLWKHLSLQAKRN